MTSARPQLRTFLLKINSVNCPSGIGSPKKSAQWEDQQFVTSQPQKSESDKLLPVWKTAIPDVGDLVLIWVNETPRPPKAAGSGLTATATVASANAVGKRLSLKLEQVALLPLPRLTNGYLKQSKRQSTITDRVRWRAHESLRHIAEDEWHELLLMARRRAGDTFERMNSMAAAKRAAPTIEELAEWQRERELVWKQIELRANQGKFREGLLKRDKCKCAVTRCETEAVLEACHLIPFSSGHPERDRQENGILLRSDIHTLFDKGLMAVRMTSRTLWVSNELLDTEYGQFKDKAVITGAANYNLDINFNLRRDHFSAT